MLAWIAETTVVAAALALVAWFAGRLLPNRPTARHALWLVVLIKLMTPPLVAWPWAARWAPVDVPIVIRQAMTSTRGKEPLGTGRPVAARDPHTSLGARAFSRKIASARPHRDDDSARSQHPRPAIAVSALAAHVWSWPRSFVFPGWSALVNFMGVVWLAVSLGLAIAQTARIIRFRRRLTAAMPAPDELLEDATAISRRLGVSMPKLLVVPDLGTPLLWCLGRPRLLLPARLVKTLPRDRWRGILTHELAHLRRGDHWVSRLELVAGLFWWWNPLYWLARARLDAEAELACDAWVVWALPTDRLTYAEVLFDICATFSLARPPAPTLGVAGSGRFFERRLTMILRGDVPCRLNPAGLLGAFVLLVFAIPSWSAAPALPDNSQPPTTPGAPAADPGKGAGANDRRPVEKSKDEVKFDDDDAAARAKADAQAKAKDRKIELDLDLDLSKLEKEIEKKFGPGSDFERQVEAFAREIETRFGADFEAKMEAFARDIEAKFGPDFEEKIEALGKEIETKLGSGSDFEKAMESLGDEIEAKLEKALESFGKEIEARLGSGSDFEKALESLGKEVEARLGSGSDFATAIKELAEDMAEKLGSGPDSAKKLKDQADAAVDDKAERKTSDQGSAKRKESENGDVQAAAEAKIRERDRRIRELEAQIDKLVGEIKALKSDDKGEKTDQK